LLTPKTLGITAFDVMCLGGQEKYVVGKAKAGQDGAFQDVVKKVGSL
jgi:hypothetical protein